ncbi:hypothetical protein P692DRAFT_201865255 [Suillus brevipes Sb2]|nr:hypothetical protein P692DRAFT_201865255 [Suillus brevipes Sb2]
MAKLVLNIAGGIIDWLHILPDKNVVAIFALTYVFRIRKGNLLPSLKGKL